MTSKKQMSTVCTQDNWVKKRSKYYNIISTAIFKKILRLPVQGFSARILLKQKGGISIVNLVSQGFTKYFEVHIEKSI